MPLYDYDHLVSVPAGVLTTYRTELTNLAGTVGHTTLADAFTKQANVALAIDNRYLGTTRTVYQFAKWANLTALRDAAKAVLDQATGIA